MSPGHNQIDRIISWMDSFDLSHLQNEDDVETKFVLPLFHYLEYPDNCRRGKYPIDDYQSEKGKPGRKREIDQIYFSVNDATKQNQDTSLLIIEAKEPEEHNLEGAIKQARYYGNHMNPLFLVITNGHHLNILKRRHLRGEEIVFDISTDQLRNKSKATELYNQLRFEQVKHLKELGSDTLAHALYVEMMNLSQRYPDIQAQLTKGDFEPSTTKEGRRLTVIKPKVAITCDLPIGFEEGSCTIEFSNIMLRGLTCHLSHTEILSSLFTGLNTSVHSKTRPYLQQTENSTFRATLGQINVILSGSEAQELCKAIDEVFQIYKNIIIETTNNLDTWNYLPKKIEGIKGFHILSVKRWLWQLMLDFSHEYDYDEGMSEWHMFDSSNNFIRIERKHGPTHAVIWPKVEDLFLPSEWISLLYEDSITYLLSYLDTPQESLFKDVGPRGVWTATYTKEWLVHQFLPKVLLNYTELAFSLQHQKKGQVEKLVSKLFPFKKHSSKPSEEQISTLIRQSIGDYQEEKEISLQDISKPKELVTYLRKIQSYLLHCEAENVPASLLRPYYAAFTDLARSANPEEVHLDYLQEKLGAAQRWQNEGQDVPRRQRLSTYNDILQYLERQAERIYKVDSENHIVAELISRAFIDIIKGRTTHFQQEQLNAAKEALITLREECRFHHHFIEPIHSFLL